VCQCTSTRLKFQSPAASGSESHFPYFDYKLNNSGLFHGFHVSGVSLSAQCLSDRGWSNSTIVEIQTIRLVLTKFGCARRQGQRMGDKSQSDPTFGNRTLLATGPVCLRSPSAFSYAP
jgi:hypothetical protein